MMIDLTDWLLIGILAVLVLQNLGHVLAWLKTNIRKARKRLRRQTWHKKHS